VKSIKTHLAPLGLATALMVAGTVAADAGGWSRSGSGTGPRGNSWSSSGSGSCNGGTCSSQQSVTGPRGTTTRSGSTSCSDGSCSHSSTATGPAGNTVTRSGTITRN
jgi:hypothetical protein